MGRRQDMTDKQRLEFDTYAYKRRLEENRGKNFEYWNEKHEQMLLNGWDLFEITKKPSRQWGNVFISYSTSSLYHAKEIVDKLRADGFFARIVCGYNKNVQRIKMHTIIFKPKKK